MAAPSSVDFLRWLDPQNALPITAAIRDALSRLSPADAPAFARNREAFVRTLETRMTAWTKTLSAHRGARLVVMHDSWSYLAERFGLQIVAAAEPNPGVPPSPAEVAALLQQMRDAHVKVVIADAYSNPGLVRELANRAGARAVTLSASGADYLALMDSNVDKLAAALRATGS